MRDGIVALVLFWVLGLLCFNAGFTSGKRHKQQPDVVILPVYIDTVGVPLGVDSLVCKQFRWMEAGDYD